MTKSVYVIPGQIELAEALMQRSDMDQAEWLIAFLNEMRRRTVGRPITRVYDDLSEHVCIMLDDLELACEKSTNP